MIPAAEKISVTIGIPAYNEAENIGKLLRSIFGQKGRLFDLREVIIILDGSTDRTAEIVRTFSDKRIRLIEHFNRAGKPTRLNELFTLSRSDVLIQFDADVVPGHDYVIDELVRPYISDRQTAMVCGGHRVRKPITFIEKTAHFGVKVWEDAVSTLGERGGRYRCTGQIRAFSRQFLKNIRITPDLGSGEDTYSFYFAIKYGAKTVFAQEEAWVYYRLAGTISDYIKQTSRFIYAESQMRKYFGDDLCDKYEAMTVWLMLKALFKNAIHSPLHTVAGFLALQFITRVNALVYRHKVAWDIAISSKKI